MISKLFGVILGASFMLSFQAFSQEKLSSIKLQKTEVLKDLDNPWDLAVLPDGTLFFSERCKGLSVKKPDGKILRLMGTKGYLMVADDLFCEGQSGAHGIALDPKFDKNHLLYFYMSSQKKGVKSNRVVKLLLDKDITKVLSRTDIITDIAYKAVGNNWGGPGSHSGGRLRFGPDGYLYVTTGDNHNGTLPQDLNRLGGKVLRVDRNGNAAPGNNIPKGGDARIYTYGHRNVQGIAFHPKTGQAFSCEHGPGHSDEVTPLIAGGNSGWDPKPEKGVECDDNYCGYISNKRSGEKTPMSDQTKFPHVMQPVYKLKGSEGMGPCTFLQGDIWKSWNNALVVGVMRGQRLEVLQINEGKLVAQTTADLPSERIRSTVVAPDGSLYIATDGGEIWKVRPE